VKIGTSLTLVAVGLILSYAVDFELPGIDRGSLGAILFYVGLLGLIVSVGLEIAQNRAPRAPKPRREPKREREPEPRRRPPAQAPYDPIVPAHERDRALRELGPDDKTRRLPPR
jgi:hypothetical protein